MVLGHRCRDGGAPGVPNAAAETPAALRQDGNGGGEGGGAMFDTRRTVFGEHRTVVETNRMTGALPVLLRCCPPPRTHTYTYSPTVVLVGIAALHERGTPRKALWGSIKMKKMKIFWKPAHFSPKVDQITPMAPRTHL